MIVGLGGYAIITGPDGIVEMDTITCNHCGAVVHGTPERSLELKTTKCIGCMRRVHRRCAGRCNPIEKQIEEYEKKMEAIRRSDELFRVATST